MQKIIKILILVAVVIIGSIGGYLLFNNSDNNNFLSAEEASQKAISFINENLVEEGTIVSLVSVSDENGLYKIKIKLGEDEIDSYITKDGKFLFPQQGIDMEENLSEASSEGTEEISTSKTDVPNVKLFIMTYCPYGLQAQKGFIPVFNLLKDKVDMGIYFVDYAMHGKEEIDENLRQYCIEKEENNKYSAYASCFMVEGKVEECLLSAKIDKEKLDLCVFQTDEEFKITEDYNDESTWISGSYPKFSIHSDFNEQYGVAGSPTFVINGVVTSIERSPEKIKEAICKAFNNPPEECLEILSEEVPSPGFGAGSSDSSEGSC